MEEAEDHLKLKEHGVVQHALGLLESLLILPASARFLRPLVSLVPGQGVHPDEALKEGGHVVELLQQRVHVAGRALILEPHPLLRLLEG